MQTASRRKPSKKMNRQTREFSTTTGPARIFIVRHGDRMDHEDKTWRKDAERPHDSPLSHSGHISAHLLGRFLAHSRGLRVTEESLRNGDVVFMTSPLQRTVETAHGMIAGMMTESGLGHLILPPDGEEGASNPPSSTAAVNEPYVKAARAVAAIYADLKAKGLPVGDNVEEALRVLGTSATDGAETSPLVSTPATCADGDKNGRLIGIDEATDSAARSPCFSSSVMSAAVMGATLSSSLLNRGGGGDGLLLSSGGKDAVPLIPIFLEPGVIEGQYWLNIDIACGLSQGNTVVRLEPVDTGNRLLTEKIVAENNNNGNGKADNGVFRTEDYHRAYVSPLVVPKRLSCPLLSQAPQDENIRGASSASAASSAVIPSLNPAEGLKFASPNTNGIISHGFSYVSMGFDPEKKQIVEHGEGVGWRCRETIANIANSPVLNGKVVIIVGHGETTMAMVKGLAYITKYCNPYYTSFTEAVRFTPEEVEEAKRLAGVRHEDMPIRGFTPEPWQRWKVREGTSAFDCPHLALASHSSLYDPVRKKKF